MSKAAKASVDYSLGHKSGDHCGICAHFEPPHGCAVVAGSIDATYWCKRLVKCSPNAEFYVFLVEQCPKAVQGEAEARTIVRRGQVAWDSVEVRPRR